MDTWNQTTRSFGDSHMEDRMEGTDDRKEGTYEIETSPMSKRSRREPKVTGKLLSLLECLRSITSHKFGPVFKHKHESQVALLSLFLSLFYIQHLIHFMAFFWLEYVVTNSQGGLCNYAE